jgi:hypothetical protein
MVVGMIYVSHVNEVGPLTLGAHPRWEYMIASPSDAAFSTEMSKLGDDGWEMVSARRASDGGEYTKKFSYEVILKRRVYK